jgi:hypothetical protein
MLSKILFPEESKILRDFIIFISHNYTQLELLNYFKNHVPVIFHLGLEKSEIYAQALERKKHNDVVIIMKNYKIKELEDELKKFKEDNKGLSNQLKKLTIG